MKEVKVKVVVGEDGKVIIENVPVHTGQQVEVTLRIEEAGPARFPLRGLPVRYVDPFLPAVDDSDWDASR